MTNISYETGTKNGQTFIKVRLGQTIVGDIRKVDGGYQYFALGQARYGGDVFPTVAGVKASIEAP